MSHFKITSLSFLIFISSCALKIKSPQFLPDMTLLYQDAATPFWFNKKRYATVESFWQMLKFPDSELTNDPRQELNYPFAREEVAAMNGSEALAAGKIADKIMEEHKINWVSFEGKTMITCSKKPQDLRYLMKEAMIKKYRYNQEVRRILKATGNLAIKMEAFHDRCDAPETRVDQLWTEIRKDLDRSHFYPSLMLGL